MLKFALTYCKNVGKLFIIDCGPIGLTVFCEVAVIYMDQFQMKAKNEGFPELKKQQRGKLKIKAQERGIIKFTKEGEHKNKLAALDLEMNVNLEEP